MMSKPNSAKHTLKTRAVCVTLQMSKKTVITRSKSKKAKVVPAPTVKSTKSKKVPDMDSDEEFNDLLHDLSLDEDPEPELDDFEPKKPATAKKAKTVASTASPTAPKSTKATNNSDASPNDWTEFASTVLFLVVVGTDGTSHKDRGAISGLFVSYFSVCFIL
jgi:hypothetical protein